MIRGLLLLLLLAWPWSASAFTANSYFADLPSNTVRDLGAFPCTVPAGDTQACNKWTDYSGFVYDSVHHQMLGFGGGHDTTATDALFRLQLNLTGPPQWDELYGPSPCSNFTAGNYDDNGNGGSANGKTGFWLAGPAPGPYPRPVTRHTYDLLGFAPNVGSGEFVIGMWPNGDPIGGTCTGWSASAFDMTTQPALIDHYSFATGTWSASSGTNYADGSPSVSDQGGAWEYDPVSGYFIIVGRYGLWTYDPATKTKTNRLSYTDGNLGYSGELVYYPPNQRMYYFATSGRQYEVVLNRSTWSSSTVTTICINPACGTSPTGETGYDYDVTNQIIGTMGNGTFYAFNPVTKVWTSQAITGGTPGGAEFHAVRYDPVDNLWFFIAGHRTWAYRYKTDFDARCAATGVIKCVGFDSVAQIPNGNFGSARYGLGAPGDSTPVIDPLVKASGTGSLHFTVPSLSSANCCGQYFTNFDPIAAPPNSNTVACCATTNQFGAGGHFFIQWRKRVDAAMLVPWAFLNGDLGGWKDIIISVGNRTDKDATWNSINASSCQPLHLVTVDTAQRHIPQMYHSCAGNSYWGTYAPFELNTTNPNTGNNDFNYQQAMPFTPGCWRSQWQVGTLLSAGGCFKYYADEWMTFQEEVLVGTRTADDWYPSTVRMWVAREGQPSVLVIERLNQHLVAGPAVDDLMYGSVWILPYMTNKDPAVSHTTANTWVDELIISRNKIADPGAGSTAAVIADTTPPTDPSGLTAVATNNRIALAWTVSTDAGGLKYYRIERCMGSGCSSWAQINTSVSATYLDTGLAATTLYRYRVRAEDLAGNLSGYSAIAQDTTGSISTALVLHDQQTLTGTGVANPVFPALAVDAGDTLIGIFSSYQTETTAAGASDSVNGAWTLACRADVTGPTNEQKLGIYYKTNSGAGPITVTADLPGTATPDFGGVVMSFSNVKTSSSLDGTPTCNTNGNAAATVATTTSITTSLGSFAHSWTLSTPYQYGAGILGLHAAVGNDTLLVAGQAARDSATTINAGTEGFTLVANATSASGARPFSAVYKIVIAPGVSPPNAPTTPAAVDTPSDNGHAITVSWTVSSSSGVTEQRVYRATTSGGPYGLATVFANNTTATYTDVGLANGTTYYYVIRAWHGGNALESADSTQVSAVPSDNLTPAAPTSLSVIDTPNDSGGVLTLTWSPSSAVDVLEQRVYRSLTSGSGYVLTKTFADNTTALYLESGLANGMTYYYVLRAWDGTQESANSTQASASPANNTPALPPAAPFQRPVMKGTTSGGGYNP